MAPLTRCEDQLGSEAKQVHNQISDLTLTASWNVLVNSWEQQFKSLTQMRTRSFNLLDNTSVFIFGPRPCYFETGWVAPISPQELYSPGPPCFLLVFSGVLQSAWRRHTLFSIQVECIHFIWLKKQCFEGEGERRIIKWLRYCSRF